MEPSVLWSYVKGVVVVRVYEPCMRWCRSLVKGCARSHSLLYFERLRSDSPLLEEVDVRRMFSHHDLLYGYHHHHRTPCRLRKRLRTRRSVRDQQDSGVKGSFLSPWRCQLELADKDVTAPCLLGGKGKGKDM